MWVEEEIEATVEFPSALCFPRLRAIRFRDQELCFVRRPRVDQTLTGLVYRVVDDEREYTVRFEPTRQRWLLERIRDGSAAA